MWLNALLCFLGGYLLGSIPFGFLAGKAKGIDIREHGSGNIGATNVLRVMGKQWGIPVFALDALKGWLAVMLPAAWLLPLSASEGVAWDVPLAMGLLAAFGCVLGHSFPIWLGFKGGKGVATTAGILIGVQPLGALLALVVWAVVFFTSRYVSLASIAAAVVLPIIVFWREGAGLPFRFVLVVALLVIWRHRSNIARLLAGTENRFVKKSK